MSEFAKTWRLTLTTLLLIIAATAGFTQGQSDIAAAGGIPLAQGFLRAAYPELQGQNLPVSVQTHGTFDHDWTAMSQVFVAIPTSGRSEQPDSSVLSTRFWLRNHGRVDSFEATGSHVHTKERRTIEQEALANPGWGKAELAGVLMRAAALYGPDREDVFRRTLHLERFEPFFGKTTRSQIRFLVHRSAVHPGTTNTALVFWAVTLETQQTASERSCYALSFEPFEGRLIQLSYEAGACKWSSAQK